MVKRGEPFTEILKGGKITKEKIDLKDRASWEGTIADPEVYGDLISAVRGVERPTAAGLVKRLLSSDSLIHGLSRLPEKQIDFEKTEIVTRLLGAEVGDVLAMMGRRYRTDPQRLKKELARGVDVLEEYGFLRPAREIIEEVSKQE